MWLLICVMWPLWCLGVCLIVCLITRACVLYHCKVLDQLIIWIQNNDRTMCTLLTMSNRHICLQSNINNNVCLSTISWIFQILVYTHRASEWWSFYISNNALFISFSYSLCMGQRLLGTNFVIVMQTMQAWTCIL